ncbi:MAG: hypothetical protein AAGI52_06145 [Bacteroidota bacterium]
MSDTPYPTDPHEGDSSDPKGQNPMGSDPLGSADDPPSGLSPEGADAFFGGATFDYDADDAFQPAIEASSFAGDADAYFEEAEISTEADPADPSGDGASAEAEALIASPKPRRRARGRTAKPSRSRSSQLVLGIQVTPTRVHGVLLRDEGDGRYKALMQLARSRSQGSDDMSGAMTPSDVGTDDLSAEFSDGSVQFGAGQELDFTGEFDGLAGPDVGIDMGAIGGAPRAVAQPIVFELRDMLEEISRNGHERPAIAFSVAPPDVEYAEILVPADKKKKKSKRKKKGKSEEIVTETVKRDKLVALLPASEPGREIDTDRVQFLPMTPREGRPRYLALVPQPTDPVVPALSMLREQSKHRRTAFKTIESEVSLLTGLSSLVCPTDPHENTAVVRVGTEDTLVLLLSGGVLHHMEPMQSVTAYDGPDTICSRVLLQQDVQGVGTVHNVIVLADEREEELVQGFAAFYPDARVASFGALLADMGMTSTGARAEGEAPLPLAPESIEAAAAALAGAAGKGSPFADVNLLPKALRKKKSRIDLSFGWHTLVVAVLLFLSVVYFIGLFLAQTSDIADRERQLAEFPTEATMAGPQLQARIDSLRIVQAEITAALGAMDSLLYGTDRWTQDLLRTSRAAAASGGVWFEEWQPAAGSIGLTGYATSRARVVSLAQRLDAVIEEVVYSTVREFPVYDFRMTVTSPIELPQTARYLREQMGDAIPPPRDALSGLDAPAPGAPPIPAPAPPPPPADAPADAPAPADS